MESGPAHWKHLPDGLTWDQGDGLSSMENTTNQTSTFADLTEEDFPAMMKSMLA